MKFICKIFALSVLIQSATCVTILASKFNGMYWGASAGYTNFNTAVTKGGMLKPIVNAQGILAMFHIGYGKRSSTFHLGGEFTLPYTNLSSKFDNKRIGSSYGIGFTPRVGYPVAPEVMASIGLGLDTCWFNRKHLYRRIFSLTPKVMVEGFIDDSLSLRFDVGYSLGVSNRKGPGVTIRKRPNALQVTVGLFYRE